MSDDFTDAEWAEYERDENIRRLADFVAGFVPGCYHDEEGPLPDVDAEIQEILDGLTHELVKERYQFMVDTRHQIAIDRERFRYMAARQGPSAAWHRVLDDEKTVCGKLHQDWEGGEWFPPTGSGKVCRNCVKYR